jgi:hypothetical protein
MVEEHRVHDAIVAANGHHYRTPFFVEGGVIHANIDGTIFRLPLTDQPPEQSIATLVLGKLHEDAKKQELTARWVPPVQRQ